MLDFFVAVPGLGAERREVEPGSGSTSRSAPSSSITPSGSARVRCRVLRSRDAPGAGTDVSWARLVEPALRLARGVAMLPAHAACLEMLAPVMTMREGERIYSPHGWLLATGERLSSPPRPLELVADEEPRPLAGTLRSWS